MGIKRWTLIATVFAFTCHPLESFATEAKTNSVIHVAKKASPAVVSINVKIAAQTPSELYYNGRSFQFEDPADFFGDRFFQDFFRSPNRAKPVPEQKEHAGQGSGFIITSDGYVLTNAHVVKDAKEITVLMNDGREFEGKIIGIDPNTDIAVIKIEGNNFPFISLGDSDALEVGQSVIAIGNPLGLQTSITAGIVSAKGRNNLSLARIEDFIQTDAAINRGNSGGPLLNLNSEVIGMNTAIVSNSGSGGYMGIGFAIPSNLIHQIIGDLIKTGSIARGFIGVTLQPINQDLAQAFGLTKVEGAIISDVSKNSPAEKAGIKQGDIVLEYNNKNVENIAALRNAIALMKPESEISLKIVRNGNPLMIALKLGTNPEDKPSSSASKEGDFGLEFETLSPEIAKKLGYRDLQGAVITRVKAGSPAAWAGLRTSALILAVNHKQIASAEELQEKLKSADLSKPILLLVKQGESMHFVSLKIGSR